MRERKYCECAGLSVPRDECDSCDFRDDDWGIYDDPPLYPAGKLAGMSVAELEAEYERQCDRQGRLGDAEYIDEGAVAVTEARCRLLSDELQRRKERAALGQILGDALATALGTAAPDASAPTDQPVGEARTDGAGGDDRQRPNPDQADLLSRLQSAERDRDALKAERDALLAALRDAVEEIEDLRRYANNNGGMYDDVTCDYGRAAIAKATGGHHGE